MQLTIQEASPQAQEEALMEKRKPVPNKQKKENILGEQARLSDAERRILKQSIGSIVSTFRTTEGPTVTKSGKPAGRNPHVGLKLPKTTNQQRVEQLRKTRKKSRGRVQSSSRRHR